MSLAHQIRQRRLQLGLSQPQLAARAGVAAKTVFRAEHGSIPNGPTLAALLAALDREVVLARPGELETLRARIAELEHAVAAAEWAMAQNRRYEAAFAALARQEVLTHDLIDQARTACTPSIERTAA